MGEEGEVRNRESEERPLAQTPESAYDIGRLLSFSDGVFAIAVTLLVLDIPVPQLTQAAAAKDLAGAIVDLYPRLIAFGVSFFVAGLYWIWHHQLFRGVARADSGLLWLNLILLFVVCAIPFSTGVFARYTGTAVGVEVYGSNLAAVGLAFTLNRAYVQFRGLLRVEPARRDQLGLLLNAIALPVGILAFVIVINFFSAWGAAAALVAGVAVIRVVRRVVRALPDPSPPRAS